MGQCLTEWTLSPVMLCSCVDEGLTLGPFCLSAGIFRDCTWGVTPWTGHSRRLLAKAPGCTGRRGLPFTVDGGAGPTGAWPLVPMDPIFKLGMGSSA